MNQINDSTVDDTMSGINPLDLLMANEAMHTITRIEDNDDMTDNTTTKPKAAPKKTTKTKAAPKAAPKSRTKADDTETKIAALSAKLKDSVKEIHDVEANIKTKSKAITEVQRKMASLEALGKVMTLSEDRQAQMDTNMTAFEELTLSIEELKILHREREQTADALRVQIEELRIGESAKDMAQVLNPGFDPGDDPELYGRMMGAMYGSLQSSLAFLLDLADRQRIQAHRALGNENTDDSGQQIRFAPGDDYEGREPDDQLRGTEYKIDRIKSLMAACAGHWRFARTLSDPSRDFPPLAYRSWNELQQNREESAKARAAQREAERLERQNQRKGWDNTLVSAINRAAPRIIG